MLFFSESIQDCLCDLVMILHFLEILRPRFVIDDAHGSFHWQIWCISERPHVFIVEDRNG